MELMLALLVVSILAAIAIPAYQTYTVRTRVSGALIQAAEAKINVLEVLNSGYFDSTGYARGFKPLGHPTDTSKPFSEAIQHMDINAEVGFIRISLTPAAGGSAPGNTSITIIPYVPSSSNPETGSRLPRLVLGRINYDLGGGDAYNSASTVAWKCVVDGGALPSGGILNDNTYLSARFAPPECRL